MKYLKEVQLSTIIGFAVSAVLSYVCDTICDMLDATFLNPFLRFLLFALGWLLLGLLSHAVLKMLNTKKIDYNGTRRGICETADNFRIPGSTTTLFEFAQDNNIIRAAEDSSKYSNVVYYSLSAKQYLNWIDYTYFVFLRMLRDKLQCKLVIGLHFPDHIKECKNLVNGVPGSNPDADPNALKIEYSDICRVFENNARQILGNNVTFVREDQFYKHNPKKYAEVFRNIYDSFVLYFACHIDRNEEHYNLFKRRVSHMESTFPVWMLAEKYRRSRLFVLDNRLTLEMWNYQPLRDVRTKNDIYFIYSNSLVDKSGKRINVHNINNVINLTDTPDEIVRKAKLLSPDEQELIISLLSTDQAVAAQHHLRPPESDPYTRLMGLLHAIQDHYTFESFPFKN